jgi:hypothetical protein
METVENTPGLVDAMEDERKKTRQAANTLCILKKKMTPNVSLYGHVLEKGETCL